MKTLNIEALGLEELTQQEMINQHGGGDSLSLGNIGSLIVADLANVNGNSLFNGNYALFSGNTTSIDPVTSGLFSFSTQRS